MQLNAEDKRKWCWGYSLEDECYYGPFETRESALRDAISQDAEDPVLGRCNFANPGDAIDFIDEAWLLENLEDHTDEELRSAEDQTFKLRPESDIQELKNAIGDWVSKNIEVIWLTTELESSTAKEGI
jgi:hypothetical protein